MMVLLIVPDCRQLPLRKQQCRQSILELALTTQCVLRRIPLRGENHTLQICLAYAG